MSTELGQLHSGSWRTNYDKPTWEGLNPYEVENEVEREDVFNQTHEATLGGPITRDRLWFFYSFRRARITDSDSFAQTGISYNESENNDRNQFKLTATLAPGHTFPASTCGTRRPGSRTRRSASASRRPRRTMRRGRTTCT